MDIGFSPIGDRIIVKAWEVEDIVSPSGLIIQVRDEVNKELPQIGEVVAIGKGGTFPDCPDPSKVFSLGDVVYFNRYAGEEIVMGTTASAKENKKYTVLRLDAVFGKLSDELAKEMIAEQEEMKKIADGIKATPVDESVPSTFDKDEFSKKLLDNRN